ncbi:MAG: hypothetical protein H6Q60_375 [Oscillospiraceae bacterium]|nr:hypothetical protein [Oscillospiraceae bacterium]
MEYENMPRPGNGPGMCGSDRDIFERVWRRVMPEDTPSSPIALKPREEGMECLPETYNPSAAAIPAGFTVPMPAQSGTGVSASFGGVSQPALYPQSEQALSPTGSDFPQTDDVPYLGRASAVHGSQMQNFILRALQSWRCYQLLSHRSSSGPKKLFSSLAAQRKQQAKQISTAYFLITGVTYFPAERITAPAFSSYLGMLRSCFISEQRDASDYIAAAEEVTDPWLRELYVNLSQESTEIAGDIRRALEQM